MAIEKDKLTIDVELNSKGAVKNLKQLEKGMGGLSDDFKKAGKESKKFEKSLDSAFKSVTLLNQGISLATKAYSAFSSVITETTKAFSVQEKAQKGLADTLRLNGEFTRTAIEDFKEFASNLQSVSVVGDEATLGFLKQAKALGLTNDQAKQAVIAAAELSAGLGKDLNSSFNQVIKTFGGFAGELGEALPQIRDLTKAQLQAGGATDLLIAKFKGQQEALANTFGGSSIQRANAFGDLLEQIGQTFVEAFDLTAVNKQATAFFEDLSRQVANIRRVIKEINFDVIEDSLRKLLPIITAIAIRISAIALPVVLVTAKIAALTAAIGAAALGIDFLVRNFKTLASVSLDGLSIAWLKIKNAVMGVKIALLDLSIEIERTLAKIPGLGNAGDAAIDSLSGKIDNLRKSIAKNEEEISSSAKEIGEQLEDIDTGAIGGIADAVSEITRAFDVGMRPEVQGLERDVLAVNEALKKTGAISQADIAKLKKLAQENKLITKQIELQNAGRRRAAEIQASIDADTDASRLEGIGFESEIAAAQGKALIAKQRELLITKALQEQEAERVRISSDLAREYKQIAREIQFALDVEGFSELEKNFERQKNQLKDFRQQLFDTGKLIRSSQNIIDEKSGKLAFVPENFKGQSAIIVSTITQIINALEKLRMTQEMSFGEKFSAGINSAATGFSDFFNGVVDGAKDLSAGIGAAADKMGFNEIGDSIRASLNNLGDFKLDLGLSPETMAGISETVDAYIQGFTKVFDFVSAGFSAISSTVSAGFDFFSGAKDFIIGFDKEAIAGLAEIPKQIADGLSNIPEFISGLGEAFLNGINAFISGFGSMIEKLGPIMIEFVINIMNGLGQLLDNLPGMVFKFMEAMVPAFQELLKRLPDLLTKIFDAIPGVIDAIISFIPEIIVSILEVLPDLIQNLIKGLIGAAGKLIATLFDFLLKGGAEKIIRAFLQAIIEIIPAIIDGIATGLKNAFTSIFKGFEYPTPDILIDKLDEGAQAFVNALGQGVEKVSDQISGVIDIPLGGDPKGPGKKTEAQEIAEALDRGGKKTVDGLKNFAKQLGAFLDSLPGALLNLINATILGIKTLGTQAAMLVLSVFEGIARILDPEFLAQQFMDLKNGLQQILGQVFSVFPALLRFVRTLGNVLGSVLQTLIKSLIMPIINSIGTAFKTAVANIVQPLGDAVLGAFSKAINFMGQELTIMFNRLGGILTSGFESITKTLDDLFNGTAVADFVNSIKSLLTDNPFDSFSEGIDQIIEPMRGLEGAFNNIEHPLRGLQGALDNIENPLRGLQGALDNIENPFRGLQGAIDNIEKPFRDLADAIRGFSPGSAAKSFFGLNKGGMVPGFADGGIFTPGGGTDTVNARLTPGEFVLNRNAVQSIGANNANFINDTGRLPNNNQTYALNVADGAIIINAAPGQDAEQMANAIIEELKIRSRNGETVVFASGIRTD